MSTATPHTPTPWKFSGQRPTSIVNGVLTVHLDKPHERYTIRREYRDEQERRCTRFIGEVYLGPGGESEMEANARLIVQAVNSFDALREALRTYLDAAKSWHEFHHTTAGIECDPFCDAMEAAERALAEEGTK